MGGRVGSTSHGQGEGTACCRAMDSRARGVGPGQEAMGREQPAARKGDGSVAVFRHGHVRNWAFRGAGERGKGQSGVATRVGPPQMPAGSEELQPMAVRKLIYLLPPIDCLLHSV